MRAAWTSLALLAAFGAVALAGPASSFAAQCDGDRAHAGWRPDVRSASAYAATRRGSVSFAVRTRGFTRGLRPSRTAPAASTMKVLFLVAWLRHARDRPLRRSDRALLDPMVRRSANAPATAIRNRLGDAAIIRLARRAGMRRFAMGRLWGMSRISAGDGTRLMLALDRLLPRRHRAYALRLLRTVVPSQRWGVGRVRVARGWALRYKGGWGSGTGAVDHQLARLDGPCGERVALAVLTTAQGTHAYGKRTLRGVFARLLHRLPAARG